NIGSFIDSAPFPFAVVAPSISLSPNPITVGVGGQGLSVTVAVNQAPTSQIAITVDTRDHNIATVTSPAIIPAGQTTTTVTVAGVSVGSTMLTASLTGYSTANATVNVTSTPQPTVNITPPSFILNAAGTDTITVSRTNTGTTGALNVTLSVDR